MTTYSVTRTINAHPDVVWNLLTDAAGYPRWNPAVLRIDGEIVDGSRIRLTSIVNPDREFKLNVTEVRPPAHMVWWDGMPFGLFKGVRSFDVTDNGDGSSEFKMEEVYSGLMAPLITKSIPDMTDSFDQFADGLKEAAESR
ncbi:MAG: SRPBCC domain-containing protein [Acidimicrobiia bacterium]